MWKQEQMERDFSPVCILTLKFLISNLITATVMLLCLAYDPWKAFQATMHLSEGLIKKKRTWCGFLDFRINVLLWEKLQIMGCKLQEPVQYSTFKFYSCNFLKWLECLFQLPVQQKKFLLSHLESDIIKILNTEPKLEQNFVHWKNFYESLKVRYWNVLILAINPVWKNILKLRKIELYIWRQLECTFRKKSVF